MNYVNLHLEKTSGSDSGMSAHIERTIAPKNADPERTHLNKELVFFPIGIKNRTEAIQHRIETAGIQRKIGKNQVRAIRIILSGSPDGMAQIEQSGNLDNWCQDNLEWLSNTFGRENIVSAVLHLDEKTPHIHATMIPLVTGERRKSKQEKAPDKKKNKKKPSDTLRLCADDVMSRTKLKEYQDTYANQMEKYGLKRGIDGSTAKHISTQDYYREVTVLNETARKNLVATTKQIEQIEQKLSTAKSDLSKEKLKNSVAKIGTTVVDGLGDLLGSSKRTALEKKIEDLKTENQTLNFVLKKSQEQVAYLNKENENEKTKHENELGRLKSTINQIITIFPAVKEYFRIRDLCWSLKIGAELINQLFKHGKTKMDGKIYSPSHKKYFEVKDSEAKIEKDLETEGRLRLSLDGSEITDWLNAKHEESSMEGKKRVTQRSYLK